MCVVELFLGVVRALQRWIQKCVVELFLGVVRALQRWIQKCVVDFFWVVRALQRWIQKCPFLNRLFAEALPEVLLDSRGAPKNKTFLESLV